MVVAGGQRTCPRFGFLKKQRKKEWAIFFFLLVVNGGESAKEKKKRDFRAKGDFHIILLVHHYLLPSFSVSKEKKSEKRARENP